MIRYLAYISLIFILLFVLAVLALLFLTSDVDPLRYGISSYALTRYGFVIDVALVLVGISGISLSIALWRSITSRSGGDPVRHRSSTYWLAWLLLVFSVLLYIFNTPLLHSMGIGGAIQRLYWLVLVLWLVHKALEVLRQASSAQTTDSRTI